MHRILDPPVGTFAGSIVELPDLLPMDIHIPTKDVRPTEDIPPASDNILVRFTVGITRPRTNYTAFAPEISAGVDAFDGAELNCSQSRRGAVPTPPVSAHDVAAGCCAAGFQSDLCPRWAIHDRCGPSHASRSVRFCPEADRRADVWPSPLSAMSDLMHCKKGRQALASDSLLKINLTGQVVAPPNRQRLG
jgi:hypothetical protein